MKRQTTGQVEEPNQHNTGQSASQEIALNEDQVKLAYQVTGQRLAKVGVSGGPPTEDAARLSATQYLKDVEGLSGSQVDKIIAKAQAADPDKRKPLKLPSGAQQIDTNSFHDGIWLFRKQDGRKFDSPFVIAGIFKPELLSDLEKDGYYKRYDENGAYQYIREVNNIIESVTIAQIRDHVQRSAIKGDIKGSGLVNYSATKEQQLDTLTRNSLSLFTDAYLGFLPNHEKPLLCDDRMTAYFAFSNVVAKVTAKGVEVIQYSNLKDFCIWKQHTIKKAFTYAPDYMQSQFADFIQNVAGDIRYNAFFSAIGYLLHNYFSPEQGRAVIAYDMELTPRNKPQGGTGKGILPKGLEQMRSVAWIDGKKIQDNNQFSYQAVTRQSQVIVFDDMKPNFNLHTLNSNLTQGYQIEQKHKEPFRFVPISSNPKTYITSNSILQAEGTTATRRKFELEFSNFYSLLARQNKEPIVETHGSIFFSDESWNTEEWNRFFTYMLESAAYYLRHGLVFVKSQNIEKNGLIQKTASEFYEFMLEQKGLHEWQKYSELYQNFLQYADYSKEDLSTKRFTGWLKFYAEAYGLEYKNENQTVGGNTQKYCKFIQSVIAK